VNGPVPPDAHEEQAEDLELFLDNGVLGEIGLMPFDWEALAALAEQPMNAQEQWEQRINACNIFLLANPLDTNTLFERAELYASAGEYDAQALDDFNLLIQLMPNHPPYLLARAAVYARQNEIAAAHADYQHVLEIEPENQDAILALHVIPALMELHP